MSAVPLRHLAALLTVTAATAALAGCGSAASTTAPSASTAASSTAARTTAAATAASTGLTLADAWVKTADAGGMTAVFGTLTNPGPSEVVVASASSDVATKVELHEVVMADGTMKMQPRAGGFTVPAGGTHVLEPGHDHLMVMGLSKAVKPGGSVTVKLTLGDGTTVAVTAVGKDFTGANETYAPTASSTSGM